MIYVPDVGDDTELMLGGPTANTAPTQSQPRATSNPMGSPPAQPGPRYYGRGGIPPFPQRKWVAVNAITREVVDTGIEQPDPDRLVLCACINKYGCICYGYYDEIPKWYRRIRILAIIFAIIATPISLLCFIPALDYMKKVIFKSMHIDCIICIMTSYLPSKILNIRYTHTMCHVYSNGLFHSLYTCTPPADDKPLSRGSALNLRFVHAGSPE